MAFADELMTSAIDIQDKAIKRAIDKHETDPPYARNGVDGYYADVPDLFKPFSQLPDPAAYEPMIGDLQVVMRELSDGENNANPLNPNEVLPAGVTILPKMNDADQKLGDWTGAAAKAYKKNFLDPFPPIMRNQFILVAGLRSALQAHQAMWASARTDIQGIATGTIQALENAEGGCCNSNTWNVFFTVLSSVTAAAAATVAVLSDGAAAPLALQFVAAASQVEAVLPPPETQNAMGETALQITDVMKKGMIKIADDIKKVERTIADSLQGISAMVADPKQHGQFIAPRPALADMHGGDLTTGKGMGYPK